MPKFSPIALKSKLPSLLKVQLVIIAICLVVAGAAQLYLDGMDAGVAAVDQESFDAYAHFAKQMQHQAHVTKAKPSKATSVWAAIDRN